MPSRRHGLSREPTWATMEAPMNALLPGDAVRLEIPSDPSHLCLVRAMVRAFAELAGFGGRQLDRIALAVDEACANVIRHAYGGKTNGSMTVACAVEAAEGGSPRLVVRLSDRGHAPPGGGLCPKERQDPLVPGGLGLRLMHDIMDGVSFCRSEDGENVLELTLACPCDAPEAP